MKVCRVVLLVTFGMIAAGTLEAQMQLPAGTQLPAADVSPDGTVLMASGTLPSGLFPDLLSATGLGVTPEIVQALPKPPETPKPLTGHDRLTLFFNDTYASPGAFVGLSAGALIDQIRHEPAKWDGDGSSYTRRFASEYGQLATRNVIHEGLAGLTGLDPRYPVCKCEGVMHRSAHALEMTFTNYRKDGRLTLDMPQIAGAYGSGIISTYWYPHHLYSPLVQGVQFGHEQMGEVLVGNLIQEFGSSLHHGLHLHALVALTRRLPDDDD